MDEKTWNTIYAIASPELKAKMMADKNGTNVNDERMKQMFGNGFGLGGDVFSDPKYKGIFDTMFGGKKR
jgi:hypothetical protein